MPLLVTDLNQNKSKGYTLIEIMIALVIFAILALITSRAMYQAFDTRARLNQQANRLSELQLALTLIERDIEQIAQRPVRGNNMQFNPAFIGKNNYIEFTRGGLTNPQAQEKRSTLKRVAYECSNNNLVRRTWEALDSVNRRQSEQTQLLSNLQECSFAYLDKNRQVLDQWQDGSNGQNQKAEPPPIGVRVTLTIKQWGNMSLLFTIPESLYAP